MMTSFVYRGDRHRQVLGAHWLVSLPYCDRSLRDPVSKDRVAGIEDDT